MDYNIARSRGKLNVNNDRLTLSQTSPVFTCLHHKSFGNTVGKGEIALYEQFLIFPTVFSKDLYSRHIKTRDCLGKD